MLTILTYGGTGTQRPRSIGLQGEPQQNCCNQLQADKG